MIRTPVLAAVVATGLFATHPFQRAAAGSQPYIGEVMWVGYSYCPRGWVEADGQLLSVANHAALFSLYGITFGGDGRTTFGLPDLRGRVALHAGAGPGLSDRSLGSAGGTESEALSVAQLPAHGHGIRANRSTDRSRADGAYPGSPARVRVYGSTADTALAPDAVTETGAGETHNNMSPFLTLRACIALEGVYPSRN